MYPVGNSSTQLTDNNFASERTMSENEAIDEIIRGEIAAVEAYEQILRKVNDDPEADQLRKFQGEHQEAIDYWRTQVKNTMQGEPSESSGTWGRVVEAFVGVSKVFGNSAAFNALKEGEEHGLELYRKMLVNENLNIFQKEEVRDRFIPAQVSHIENLNALIKIQ